jgi:hypothetical protein
MICAKPWRPNGGSELPCGQCMPCRINKRNIWTTRLLLEETQHEETTWLTLTYNDRYLPYNEELNKIDYKLWLKRIRKAYPTQKIRFYLCGEYGDNSGRPHYHIVLFGIGVNYIGLAKSDIIDRDDNGKFKWPNRVRTFDQDAITFLKCWTDSKTKQPKGNIHFAKTSPALMTYACSHITKGLDDSAEGRQKPFHTMSPGLGKNAMHAIVSWLCTEEGITHYRREKDVPAVVRIDKKMRPIGKYLRNIIRKELGLPEGQTDEAIYQRGLEELSMRLELGKNYKEPLRTRHYERAKQIYSFNKQRRHL